ncbi:TlpA family protein disulfide reductase [Tropheryma whipplei]|uniref:TlpA family protein disulfide reductase n=1 Tax=Tropheryma whipplei TaxID=2039 RepID=UPI0004B5A045|nr:TlpA disulfide reductase family protein [Tropheryma whipplei]
MRRINSRRNEYRPRHPASLYLSGNPRNCVLFSVSLLLVLSSVILSGCFYSDTQTQTDSGEYLAGVVKVVAPENRVTRVKFSEKAIDPDGQESTYNSVSYAGKVQVVNFWYAACPPCREEAPILEEVWSEFKTQNVQFIGVNIRDNADVIKAFARKFKITFPSIIDVQNASVRLAFAGQIPPNGVPVTYVLDKKGFIAVRILGRITSKSILTTLIRDVSAETDKKTYGT